AASKTMPKSRPARACGAGFPFTRTVPAVGRITSPMIRSSVDLPQPDGPISETNSRSPIASSIPSRAVVPPSNVLPTSLISTTLMPSPPDYATKPVRPTGLGRLRRRSRHSPQTGIASDASCDVLGSSPDDDRFDDHDRNEERDP